MSAADEPPCGASGRRFSMRSGAITLAATVVLIAGGSRLPLAQGLLGELKPPVTCGRQIPVEWCGEHTLDRPDAFAAFRPVDEDMILGGMTFFRRGEGLVFYVFIPRLADGDYKIVLDETRGCEAYDPQAVARAGRPAPLRVRGELNLTTLYPGSNGSTVANGEVYGLSLEAGPFPMAAMTALVVQGGDLTESVVAASAIVACGRVRLNR